MIRFRFVASFAFLVVALAAVPVSAQEVGLRAGVSASPDQFYFGGHLETPPLLENLYFRPNAEIGIGNDLSLVSFNVEFAYHFANASTWHAYAGAGPALNFIRHAGNTDSEGGFNLLIGVQHSGGLFAEVKAGLQNSPNFKVGVGYAFHRR